MKNIFKYILTATAVVFAAASCMKEEVHKPGEADVEGCYGVYFPTQEASGSHSFDPTMEKELTFTVARKNTKGAIDVPFQFITDTPDAFKYDTIAFEDGQTETEFTVKFPEIVTGVDYKFTISVTDPEYASLYSDGATSVDGSVVCVAWKKFYGPGATEETAEGVLTPNTVYNIEFEGTISTEMLYYDTSTPDIRFCKLVGAMDYVEGEEPIDYIFYWNTKTNNLYVPDQWIGYTRHNDNLDINIGDIAAFYDSYYAWGATPTQDPDYFTWQPQWIKKNGFLQPYYDEQGGFYLADCIYLSKDGKATGSGWSFGADSYDGFDLFVAAGFTRVDYSFEMKTDYTDEGRSPLYFKAGADIAKIKYVAVEGKLVPNKIEELVAGLANGTVEGAEEVVPEDGNAAVSLTFQETGLYTAVAVAFDKDGKAQANASVVIDYVAAGDDTYDVTLEAGTEDTHSRFAPAGYTNLNSFGFYVYGTDLTEVRLGLYKTATVSQYGMDAVVADLLSDDESVLTEEGLAKVNGVGGYSDLFTGLDENTSYTLIVWATNGTKAKIVTAEYKTAKSPEKFKRLGTGSYTDDIIPSLYEIEVTTYDVEILESEETPGKYKVVDPYGPTFPYYDESIYTPGEYALVIDATNPDRVYFASTDTGIDIGDGMISFMSSAYYYMLNGKKPDDVAAAGLFGTMKDGVITFPAKAIFVGLGSTLYYGNLNGEFKVVLPAASEDTPATETAKAGCLSNAKSASKEFAGKQEIRTGVRMGISYEREAVIATFKATPIAAKAETERTLKTIESTANLAY